MRSRRTIHEQARLVGDGIIGDHVWTALHEHYLLLRERKREFKAWLGRHFPTGFVDDEIILNCYFDCQDGAHKFAILRDEYVVKQSGKADVDSVKFCDDDDGLTLKQSMEIQKKWEMNLFYGDDES